MKELIEQLKEQEATLRDEASAAQSRAMMGLALRLTTKANWIENAIASLESQAAEIAARDALLAKYISGECVCPKRDNPNPKAGHFPGCPQKAQGEIKTLQARVPQYAYSTVDEYENIVGFKVNDSFKIGFTMARTTMQMLQQLIPADPKEQPTHD